MHDPARDELDPQHDDIPGVTDDPVFRLLLTGRARDLHEAEEIYLDESIPENLELLGQPSPMTSWPSTLS